MKARLEASIVATSVHPGWRVDRGAPQAIAQTPATAEASGAARSVMPIAIPGHALLFYDATSAMATGLPERKAMSVRT
jgi:hypothetical protein